MKKFSGKVVALLMAISLIVGAGGSYAVFRFVQNQSQEKTAAVAGGAVAPDQETAKLKAIHDLIENEYYKKISSQDLYDGAINGMIDALNDPFSSYMNAKTASDFSQSLSSSFQGIGAEVQMVGKQVTVVSPIKGSPAEKVGLKPKDAIMTINGKSTEGLTINQAVNKIRGKKGTVVKIGIKRSGASDLLTFSIKRDDIPIRTVESKMLKSSSNSIGYIAITQFNENTDGEFSKALDKLENEKMQGLIIDVRGNPGGYLQAVEKIGNLLISSKKPIVQIQNREGKKQPFYSTLEKKKDYPIAALIDDGSASASEILAGALKEAGGYPLIGVKSFGKGTVQQSIPMTDKSELKLTVDKWLTPDSNWIHKKGIQPTIEVKQPDYYYVTPINLKKGQTFRVDQTDEKIANAQKMLKAAGQNPGRTDGYFSKQTQQALKAFQKENKLPESGEIDQKTADALQQATLNAIKNQKHDRQLNSAIEEIKKELK
ncbi:S41 family peptidase [Sporolactobacillus terrae]|uniref:PDZ domain-containing protein n=1 Tax=Sporolactobacillus terrae TaxID=269673 RepID=A0A410D7B6_9BACL|nr:S41 family peptidase [Sporolactobacillus terrae]QAA21977.1 PDZ domain-containing protein [Sporolactobacillus terrae]QAA24950.1 PDZ domain-containing protein [Sporolactobacillus terrae]UAK16772.1 peptidoglycan-binding protein [Sporolactobacillus terrae]BBN98254.1 peptidase S41 [Sporolactobacillus terrae]